jgi:integrase
MATLVSKFGDRPAEDIEPLEIGNWLTSNTQWAPATKNRFRALISLVYRQAMRNGKTARNPARLVAARVENNGRTRYLLDDEERELRKVMAVRYPHYLDVLVVALNTGMRKGEQFSLTWDAVDLESRKIRLIETKNGSSRTIPINTPCLTALKNLRATSRDKRSFVFLLPSGGPMKEPRSWFTEALKDAKIDGLRWHDLRHTFCSRLAMAGVDIRTIAALAGHKTLQMSMRYAHLAPAHNLDAIEKLIAVT